ncbi:MAG: bifunctional precorrin-2 dehydrogenase/sirohydrochlorin ferrochelatase [Dehalococcoidia bacterium]|nr:bifunctional precorrin-2 dehydrogenase/sirohydrochlorin ferrochelatase [Dehalococcoidia bacterium]
MSTYYPVYLDLKGRRCLVFGGNHEAEKKAASLLASGAHVELIAWEITPKLQELANAGEVAWRQRDYRAGDLAGVFLAIVADTSNLKLNQAVHEEAEVQSCLLNVADIPALCNWIAPAIVRRGPVTVAVSTGGLSPALARRLREGLERSPARGADCCIAWADAGELLGEVRANLRARGVNVSAEHWQACMSRELLELCQRGEKEKARVLLTARLEAGAGAAKE